MCLSLKPVSMSLETLSFTTFRGQFHRLDIAEHGKCGRAPKPPTALEETMLQLCVLAYAECSQMASHSTMTHVIYLL
jgi:hypothetical protein